ncbi:uncharacterized protein EAF01_001314 [Botrytis porri]|uniref:AA1-like domain-containing protein n=1 Tax=Botrytis porri TaxID=87229 RepID=A0A4Z1KD26_9HELO|nr:uncharacterized protein EAF01_001314 [Botrytis porri]KAF7912293.1 hypothetical protein EAF01_001314 [Botrytis porri]TGO84061.1 hypothetical protein BPOR_0555g00050 [Botrytis porri]
MNTRTLTIFVALMVSGVIAVPIDRFTEDDAFQLRRGLNTTTGTVHVARNDYPSVGDVVLTFYARNGEFFQQTFAVDGNNYVIDNPLKIAKIVAEGTGYCAITGYSGSFTQTQNTCGPLTVSPVSVQVWGQCSTALPVEGFGLDVVPN